MASFVNSNPVLRIGIVVGETSGDLLAADLFKSLKLRGISFVAEGIAGPEMQEQGCHSLFSMETLTVMGLGEILKQLPQLLRVRRQLIHHFISNPPDVFIGVDAPEFNLGVEKKLKQHGIPTVHYVSPSVWAWRRWRLKKIAKGVDLMLTLFPFEKQFYQKHHVFVEYVGHPFADVIPLDNECLLARQNLALSESAQIIALLPGSRRNEIDYLGRVFLQTALRCHEENPALIFVAAMVNKERAMQFVALKNLIAPKLPLIIIEKQSRQVMAAADVVLLASGTATLEAMLLKKPMVVAYKMSALSYCMAKLLIKVDHIALPNLLAGKTLVPEFVQEHATSKNLANALFYYLNNPARVADLQGEFLIIHQQLRCNASEKAVTAILKLLHLS
ncbi:MAG: lipid-A-disaccharide synthase [Rickettsiella sp.]|nr:lipid-A-disaccharide synthase [Rickettsiella sp.]